MLPAHPLRVLDELRSGLRAAVASGTGASAPVPAEQADGFVPHVSIAHANGEADSAPYAAALASVTPKSVPVTLGEASTTSHWTRCRAVVAPES